MTQAQLVRLCKLWQRRLRLSDWDIVPLLVTEADMPEEYGCGLIDGFEMHVDIKVRDFADSERTLIHELLHIRLIPFSDGDQAEPHHEAREVTINLLADCYMRAYQRRKPKTGGTEE